MSATTAVLPSRSKLNADWRARLVLAGELTIGILWILGALHYVRQEGRLAPMLLAGALLLLVPRIWSSVSHLVRPASAMQPGIWVYLLGLFLPEHLTSGGTVIAPHLVPLLIALACLLCECFTLPLAAFCFLAPCRIS